MCYEAFTIQKLVDSKKETKTHKNPRLAFGWGKAFYRTFEFFDESGMGYCSVEQLVG